MKTMSNLQDRNAPLKARSSPQCRRPQVLRRSLELRLARGREKDATRCRLRRRRDTCSRLAHFQGRLAVSPTASLSPVERSPRPTCSQSFSCVMVLHRMSRTQRGFRSAYAVPKIGSEGDGPGPERPGDGCRGSSKGCYGHIQ
ncbi:hypothetical protein OH76DRAFT_961408 [Lentinus brumalis]|uniref:Uncharacterized protein n=1 Tax=Lentinus brumalis TaxID=2498619 RepID=A0A371DPG4_9APHY|nr:hypothetical protein OH76DRAFT_961408 [Polyporus brumalis]